MGAEPWSCWAPYREDIEGALEDLKRQEFEAGRYRKPWGFKGTHATIEEAVAATDADGTCSILDMDGVAEAPRVVKSIDIDRPEFEGDDFIGLVAPLSPEQLVGIYGTEHPSRAMIEENDGYYDLLDRGLGIYIIAYDGGTPSELFFAGYSYD